MTTQLDDGIKMEINADINTQFRHYGDKKKKTFSFYCIIMSFSLVENEVNKMQEAQFSVLKSWP